MRKLKETETFDLHFELGHLSGIERFDLAAGRNKHELKSHTSDSLAQHSKKNRALGLLPEDKRAAFTHYVEGVELPVNRALILRVTYPVSDTSRRLPGLALLAVRIPRATRAAHRRTKFAKSGPEVPMVLNRFDVAPDLPADEALEVSLDADNLITPTDTAVALLFQHPQLASVNPTTASIVIDDHIQTQANSLNVSRLDGTIKQQGTGWQSSVNSTDSSGNTLTWGPLFQSNQGQPVECYQLSAETITGLAAPLSLPLATSQDDLRLQNSNWATNQGIGSIYQVSSSSSDAAARSPRRLASALGAGDPSSDYTVDNQTPGHGLNIDDSSLVFTPDDSTQGAGTLAINVMNNYLRSLWAYVAFYDASGNYLDASGNPSSEIVWNSVGLVSPVNVVLGIPMPTDPTNLSFNWPSNAASATLAHGGLGTSNWINDIVWNGVLLTGVFNYAIPGLFLIIGSELDSDAWLKELEEEAPIQVAVFKAGVSIIGTLDSNSIGFPNIKTIFSAFADGIAGLLAHAGLEELQEYIIEKLGEAALEDAIPYVDIIFEVANRAVDLVEIGETTVEVLTSPAVYEVNIRRAMPLQATVSPDPTHGTATNPAIWPLDSDHYQAVVQYKGGTSYTNSGPMLGANSSEPVVVNYSSIPEGGTLQVQFNVYSSTNTLLGRWTSSWVPALRPQPGATLSLSGAIQETLVPLTSDTLYDYKEKLVFNSAANGHMWQPNQFEMDSSVITSLNDSQVSGTIQQYFQNNASTLSASAQVQVVSSGQAWNIVDGSTTYILETQTLTNSDGQQITVVLVNTNNAPTAVLPLNTSDQGNNLGALAGITISNRAYMLGYCWMASGQNVPEIGTTGPPVTSQTNTFQNINVLSDPEASLKFSGYGFPNQPFLVYDQFGPVPLFSVSSSFASELNEATVASDLATLFQQFAYPLPTQGVTVTVVTSGVEWTINVNGQPTYSLLSGGGEIDVYSYPAEIISQNNFYLEPTSTDPDNYQYQLRQVTLDNTTPFDMDQTESWGLFILPKLNDVVVHPQGYVIGAHYNLNLLEILQLPAQATPDDQAIPAVIVGGQGTRPGLFNGPAALAVTADGRILVLEQSNNRIQAIDVNGNPVACFAGTSLPSVPTSYAADLDEGLVSSDLRNQFQSAGAPLSSIWRVQDSSGIYQLALSDNEIIVTSGGANLSTQWEVTDSSPTPQSFSLALDGSSINVSQNNSQLFTVPSGSMTNLNSGSLGDTLSAAFTSNNITLVAPIQITGDLFALDISDLQDLTNGVVPSDLTDGLSARGITLSAEAAVTASVAVRVVQSTVQWLLQDQTNNTTYQLLLDTTAAPNVIDIVELLPTMPLKTVPDGTTITYIGLATETKGYIYALSYTGDGTSILDFVLDIYQPSGALLASTSGVNAGDIVIDMWRNLYSLNFESLLGPGGRTEPSISIWTPST